MAIANNGSLMVYGFSSMITQVLEGPGLVICEILP